MTTAAPDPARGPEREVTRHEVAARGAIRRDYETGGPDGAVEEVMLES